MRTKRFLSLLLVLTMLATMLTVMPVFAQTGEPGLIEVTADDDIKSLDLTSLMSEEEERNMQNGGEVTVEYTIEFVGNTVGSNNFVDLIAGDQPTEISMDADTGRYLRTRIYSSWKQLDMFSGFVTDYGGPTDNVLHGGLDGVYDRLLNVGGNYDINSSNTYTYNTKIVINNNANTLTQITSGKSGDTALSGGSKNGKEYKFAVSDEVDKTTLMLVAYNGGKNTYSVKDITVSVAAPEPYLSLDKDFARIDGEGNVTITPTCTNFDAADLKWSRRGSAMTMEPGKNGAITVSKGDAQPGDAETFTASYTNGGTTLEASCTLVYVPNYGYTLYDDNGSAYMYLGANSLSNSKAENLDFTKGQTDINDNTLSISESWSFSNNAATITLPEIDLNKYDYDRVVINAGVGSGNKVTATVKVGETELGTIKDMNTGSNGGWDNYTSFGVDFNNNTAKGNVVIELTKNSSNDSDYAGNYVYVKFLKGLDSEVIPEIDDYPGVSKNFSINTTSRNNSDSNTYTFADNVNETERLIFADENEPSAVAPKFSGQYMNYIGNTKNSSSIGNPKLTGLNLEAGNYTVYYLGSNHNSGFLAVNEGEKQSMRDGVEFAKSTDKTLYLYKVSLALENGLTNGTLEFSSSTNSNGDENWLPDLYSVVIVRDIGFGEGFADSGRYSVNSGGDDTIYGVIRYLQAYTGAQPSEYGFYFIDNETGKIIQGSKISNTIDDITGGFYGDLNEIPQGSFGKYSAKAFVTVGGTTYFADSIGGEVTKESDMVVYPDTGNAE